MAGVCILILSVVLQVIACRGQVEMWKKEKRSEGSLSELSQSEAMGTRGREL